MGSEIKQYLDDDGNDIKASPDMKIPAGYSLLSSKKSPAAPKKTVKELKLEAAKRTPVVTPKGYLLTKSPLLDQFYAKEKQRVADAPVSEGADAFNAPAARVATLYKPTYNPANQAAGAQSTLASVPNAPKPKTIGEEVQAQRAGSHITYVAPNIGQPSAHPDASYVQAQPLISPEVTGTLKEVATHPLEVLTGASLPSQQQENMQRAQRVASETNDPFLKAAPAVEQRQHDPTINISGTKTFQKVLDPKSKNVFSRVMTGGTKGVEALSSVDNLGLMAGMYFSPADAGQLISAVFSAQMAQGAGSQGIETLKAAYRGDYGEAAEKGANALVSAAFASTAGKHALGIEKAPSFAESARQGLTEGAGDVMGGRTITDHPFTPVVIAPSRDRTNVLATNSMGSVRQAKGQAPSVWLNPAAWESLMKQIYPDESAASTNGFNVPKRVLESHAKDPQFANSHPEITELLTKANEGAGEGGAAIANKRGSIQDNVRVMREELNHTWQRSLAAGGDFENHLKPGIFSHLRRQIPQGMYDHLLYHGYDGYNSPQMVTEAAAKLMGGRASSFSVTPEEKEEFLDSYFSEVADQHGADSLNSLTHLMDNAQSIKEKVYAEYAGKENTGTDAGLGNKGTDGGALQSMAGGGQGGAAEIYQGTGSQVGSGAEEVNGDTPRSARIPIPPEGVDANGTDGSQPQNMARTGSEGDNGVSLQQGGTGVSNEAAGTSTTGLDASPDMRQRLSDFMTRVGTRLAREQYGQDILDDMEERKESPAAVSKHFWEHTYFDMPAEAQVAMQRQLRAISGMQPGDTLAVDRNGERIPAKDWAHIADGLVGDKVEYLEGGERGYVSMMRDAIDRFGKKPNTGELSVGDDTAPIRAYHGTEKEFEGVPRTDGLGVHFSPSRKMAESFTNKAGDKARVIEANLGIKNPIRVEDYGGSHAAADGVIRDFVKQGILPESFLNTVEDGALYKRSEEIVGDIGDLQGPELAAKRASAFERANIEALEKVKEYLKDKGYDGIIYDNKTEGHGDSYVAFDPKQITLAGQDDPLFNREKEKPYKELDRLDPKATMGTPNSAAIITGDGKVKVGEGHYELMEENGYKNYADLFAAGGVRIRPAYGGMNIEIGKIDNDVLSRVRKTIASFPGMEFTVEFTPANRRASKTISGGADLVLLGLEKWQRVGEAAAKYASPSYWHERGNDELFNREVVAKRAKDVKEAQDKGDTDRLIALHNTSPDGIIAADKLGGIPAPSMAILKPGMEFESYGPISLVGNRDLVDPQRNPDSHIFDSDVYSSRQPRPSRKLIEKKADEFESMVRKSMPEDLRKEFRSGRDSFNSFQPERWERLKDDYANSAGVQYAYLKSIGKAPEIKATPRHLRYEWAGNQVTREWLKTHDVPDYSTPEGRKQLGDLAVKAVTADAAIYEKAGLGKVDDYVTQFKKDFLDPNGEMHFAYADHLDNDLRGLKGNTQEIDRHAARRTIEDTVKANGGQEAVKKFVDDHMKDSFGSEYLQPARGARRDYTLENVLEEMTKGRLRGSEQTMTHGLGKARADAAHEFAGVEDLRKESGRIAPQKEVSAEHDALQKKFIDWQGGLKYKYNDQWDALDDASRALGLYLKGPKTPAGMRSALNRVDYDTSRISDDKLREGMDIAKEVIGAKAEYFEAKLQNAPSLKDFTGAVVPKDTSPEVMDVFKKHGVKVETYDPSAGKESRVKAIEKLHDGALFNREQTKTPEFRTWFGDSKITDEKGEPLVMYHGTYHDFDAFNPRASFGKLGAIFVSPDPEFVEAFSSTNRGDKAEKGGRTIPLYVKAEKPFDFTNKDHINHLLESAGKKQFYDPMEGVGTLADYIKRRDLGRSSFYEVEDPNIFREIKNLGYDAVWVNEQGVKNLAVFNPKNLKSAIGNKGTFDPHDPNILRNREKSDYEQTKIPTETGYRSMVDTGSVGIVDLTKEDYDLVKKLSGGGESNDAKNMSSFGAQELIGKLISYARNTSDIAEKDRALAIMNHVQTAARDNGIAGVPILSIDPNRTPAEQRELEMHEAVVHGGQRVVEGNGLSLQLFPKSVTDAIGQNILARKAWYALRDYSPDMSNRALLALESEAWTLSGKFTRGNILTDDESDELMWEHLQAQTAHHGEKLNTIDPKATKYVQALREAAKRHDDYEANKVFYQSERSGLGEGSGQEKEVPSPSGTPEGGGVEGDQGDSGTGSEGVGDGGEGESESGSLEDRIAPIAAGQESSLESNTVLERGGGESPEPVDRGSTGTTPTTVIPIKGNTVLAAAPVQIPVVPVIKVHTSLPHQTTAQVSVPLQTAMGVTPVVTKRILPLSELKVLAAGMNPNPQRQVASVRELMKMARSRMIP